MAIEDGTAILETPAGADAASSTADTSSTATETEVSTETTETPVDAPESTTEQPETETTEQQPETDEEDLSEFKGSVTARLRELGKRNPDLAKALADPKVRDAFAATFRREEGYREAFPTVGEAREMRSLFPRGIEDAKALLSENEEVAVLDRMYYSGDPRQHEQYLSTLHQQDPKAFASIASVFPKAWAQLDPKGYQRTFGKILGATFESQGLFGFAGDLVAAAKESGNQKLISMATELAGWINRYDPNARTKPDPRQEEYDRREAELNERDEKQRTVNQEAFGKSFTNAETEFQSKEIDKLLQGKLPKGLPEPKTQRIVNTIKLQMVERLSASRPFMRALQQAIDKQDLKEALAVSRSAWTRLLPSVARRVVSEETPLLVSTNKTAVDKKRAAASKTDAGSGSAPSGAPKPGAIDRSKLANMSYVEQIKYLTGRK